MSLNGPLTPAPLPQGGEGRVDLVLLPSPLWGERGEGEGATTRGCTLPSPPWGRGWTAAGAFFSRGGPGEGVLSGEGKASQRSP
jgi:hypothetical protein